MKKFLATLLSVLILVTGVAFAAACNKDDGVNVLKTYILKQEGSPVDDEFELPNKIGGKNVTWSSNDTTTISIENGDNCYIAKVTMHDDTKNVILTVKQGENEKSFEVTVMARDVYYLADKYTFPQNGLTVYEDFDLATTYSYKGATAEISWEMEESAYAKLNADKNKCIVNGNSTNPTVQLTATFTYNNETATAEYSFKASVERTHLEDVDYWYTNTGVASVMTGYIVVIGETNATSGDKGCSLYIIDEDYCAGYYIYRGDIEAEDEKLLAPGVQVTVNSPKNQVYNGLVETSGKPQIAVNKEENGTVKKIDDVLSKVYAIDNDLLAEAPAAIYNQSRLVSLEKWEVASKPASAPVDTGALFTLKKGDVEVSIAISKYLKGIYDPTNTSDDTYKALIDLYTTVNVGDVVSVKKGLLSNYKGHQILPIDASDIVKESGDATAVPEFCAGVKAAITTVNGKFTSNIISENGSITVPASEGDVAIKAEIVSKKHETVALENNVFTITVGEEEVVSVQVTYTVGTYSTVTFHTIHTRALTNSVKVETALETVKNITVNAAGEQTLAAASGEVTFTWAPKEGTTLPDGVTLNEGKLNIAELPEEETTVTLTVTATCGDANSSKDVTVTIKAAEKEDMSGTYKLSLNQVSLNKTLYFTGAMNQYYYATSENVADAADVVVAKVEGGYTLKAGEKYLEIEKSGTYINVKLNDTASKGVWSYNSELKIFTWDLDGTVYYLGTSGTYNTISANAISKITGDNTSAAGTTQFVVSYDDVLTGTFKLSLNQVNLNKTLYFTGAMNQYYYGTTENVADAADVVVAKVEGGYTFKAGEKYLEIEKSGTYINVKLNDTASKGVWKYDSALNVFTWDLEGTKYYLGTSGTYNTISANAVSKISGDNASAAGTTQFVAKFEIPTAEQPPVEEEDGGTPATLTFGGEISANDAGISSYSGTFDAVRDGFTYTINNFNNNNNGWDHIRTGHKTNATTGTITTQKVAPAVTKVVVTIKSVNPADKVKSFKLKVYSDKALTQAVTEVSCTIAQGENTFTIDADKVGEGYYYQIEIDCDTASNGFVQLSKVEFVVAENA